MIKIIGIWTKIWPNFCNLRKELPQTLFLLLKKNPISETNPSWLLVEYILGTNKLILIQAALGQTNINAKIYAQTGDNDILQ